MNEDSFFHKELLKSIDKSIAGEQFIKMYYKFPLGLYILNDLQTANEVYSHLMNQAHDKPSRVFDIYYDCWLYLYTKCAGNPNSKLHYEIIMNNKTAPVGFSALPDGDPELRATAISMICACIEKDRKTVEETTEYIFRLYKLNDDQNNFYFKMDKQSSLIKIFHIDEERTHVFRTQKARPMLYSFSLAVISLLYAYKLTVDSKYIIQARKYAEYIMRNDYRNNYCGKSLVAISMLYDASKRVEYIHMADSLVHYIKQLTVANGVYKHNGQIVPLDRLSEYAIGLKYYGIAKNEGEDYEAI